MQGQGEAIARLKLRSLHPVKRLSAVAMADRVQGRNDMKKLLGIAVGATLMATGAPAWADDHMTDKQAVMDAARAQWAAGMRNASAAEIMATVADDYTEFNGSTPALITGKDTATALTSAYQQDGSQTLYADMENAHVQIYGDTAILSYNYVGVNRDKDGNVEPQNAKSTRVYVRMDGEWKLVHANFQPVPNPGN